MNLQRISQCDVLADDLAGGIQLLLFLLCQVQDHDLFNAPAADAAGDTAVDTLLTVFPVQQDGAGRHAVVVAQ